MNLGRTVKIIFCFIIQIVVTSLQISDEFHKDKHRYKM